MRLQYSANLLFSYVCFTSICFQMFYQQLQSFSYQHACLIIPTHIPYTNFYTLKCMCAYEKVQVLHINLFFLFDFFRLFSSVTVCLLQANTTFGTHILTHILSRRDSYLWLFEEQENFLNTSSGFVCN